MTTPTPEQTPTTPTREQVEAVKQREIREGNLFDCPKSLYAATITVGGNLRCKGYRMGVGGVGLGVGCETCPDYYLRAQRSPKDTEVQSRRVTGADLLFNGLG